MSGLSDWLYRGLGPNGGGAIKRIKGETTNDWERTWTGGEILHGAADEVEDVRDSLESLC